MSASLRVSRVAALLRYHRPQQFGWRLIRTAQRRCRSLLPEGAVFRSGRRAANWSPSGRSVCAEIARHRTGLWPGRWEHIADVDDGVFAFLGQRRNLSAGFESRTRTLRWDVEAPRLWRFHLQCQEYLLDVVDRFDAATAWQLVGSWLQQPAHCSPVRDPDAWHPFCISRRLPVWLALAARHELPGDLKRPFWQSIADQLFWLKRNREWDLGGNHLLENLSTLFLAEQTVQVNGKPFRSGAARRLVRELKQQILPSGEHYERTPTYHLLMIACVLQCLQASIVESASRIDQAEICDQLKDFAARMLSFARAICQPDGNVPLLGDSVRSETPDLSRLIDWADALGVDVDGEAVLGPDYWSADCGDGTRLLFDAGPLACDHLPAHGHADLLQVTACIENCEAIIDTGVFQYEAGDRRLRCRRTAAHNVLQLGQQEQCDVWSSFRMGRRGHILWRHRGEREGIRWSAAAHDGFKSPCGRVILSRGGTWFLVDWFLASDADLTATSRLHWHPSWELKQKCDREVIATHRTGAVTRTLWSLTDAASIRLAAAEYYSDFGQTDDNVCVELEVPASAPGWIGYAIGRSSVEDPAVSFNFETGRLSVAFDGQTVLDLECRSGRILSE